MVLRDVILPNVLILGGETTKGWRGGGGGCETTRGERNV